MKKKDQKIVETTDTSHFQGLMQDFSDYLKVHQKIQKKHQKNSGKSQKETSQKEKCPLAKNQTTANANLTTHHTQKAQLLIDKIEDLVQLVEHYRTNQSS